MTKRLLLHAGIHRTATTAIQRTFRANEDKLARQGIRYPRHYAPTERAAWNHQRLAWDVHSGRLDHDALRAWIDELAAGSEPTVVLSAEDFCILKDLEFLELFCAAFDTEVVFYLRRQDNWVNSWYCQHKRWPFDAVLSRATPVEFLSHLDDFYWICYFDTLERWAAKLGRERVHVRVFEAGQIEDPVADLCDLCGMRALLDVEVGKLNESLPADQVEILRRLGLNEHSDGMRWAVQRALMKVPSTASAEIFPRSIRSLILGKYATQNQKVAERYLHRPDKVLFRDLSMANSPDSLEQTVDTEQLFSFVRHLIEELSSPQAVQPKPPANGASRSAPSSPLTAGATPPVQEPPAGAARAVITS